MKVFFLIAILIFPVIYGFSVEFGGAVSLDYYNNPIEDSAPSPIQKRLVLFHNLSIGYFNLRSGIGITDAYYEVSTYDLETPVFNDMYSGFYTYEFDIYTYPGFHINVGNTVTLGISGGIGVRLPVLTKIDDELDEDFVNNSFNWFYSEMHYLFWGAEFFSFFKLPLRSTTKFYFNISYKDFIYRDNQWLIGATTGLLWQFN